MKKPLIWFLALTGAAVAQTVGPPIIPPGSVPSPYIVSADGYVSADASISASSSTLSVPSRACTQSDRNKIVVLDRAGATSAPLKTTVTGCSGNSYTLATTAGTTVTNTLWGIGTDTSAAINSWVNANPGKCGLLPPGIILWDAASVVMNNACLQGQDVPAARIAPYGQNANYGTTVILASTTTKPLVFKQGNKIKGVNFFWPGQGGQTVNPVVYPPLLNDNGVDQMSDLDFVNNSVINAYDWFVQNSASIVTGGIHLDNNRVYAIHYYNSLSNVGEVITNNADIFGPSVFFNGAVASPTNLAKWTAANGEYLHVFGNGTSTTCSSTLAGGFTVSAGTVINGVAIVTHLQGGSLDEAIFDSSVDMNGVGQVLYVEQSGRISRTSYLGRIYPNGNAGVFPTANAFDWEGTCTGGAGATTGDTTVHADIIGASQGVFQVNGTNIYTVNLANSLLLNYGFNASGVVYALYATAPNAYINMNGLNLNQNGVNTNYHGVQITNVQLFSMTGVVTNNIYWTLDLAPYVSGQGIVTGVVTGHSAATKTINGASANVVIPATANNFDKP